jgi:putative ABC transport system permease protein
MRLWHWLTRRSQEDRELDEEVQFHLAEEARLRISRGEAPDSARLSARRDFGNVTRVKEVTREAWAWSALDRLRQDLRFSIRMFGKSPAFTALAITALALGIGATTGVYSVVHAVLLRSLPFPNADRLVMVWETQPKSGQTNVVQTGNFLEWRKRNQSFDELAAIEALPFNLEGAGDAVQVPGLLVTAGFFETLGTRPLLGHTIRPEDDHPDVPEVMVLSYGLWQRRFGGRTDVVGSRVIFGEQPAQVIGVMPPDFHLPTEPRIDAYVPMRIRPGQASRDGRNFSVVARLRSSVSLGDADAEMRRLAAQTAQERPDINTGWSARVVPLLDETVGKTRITLLVVWSVAGIVLLIACANVANLLLMRASARRREMNVRAALGAGRWRLLHQLLTESMLLALAGGLAGFLLAYWGVPSILRLLPADFPLPRRDEIAVDRAALWFTALVSFASGVFFGMFPAMQVDHGHLSDGLRYGGRHGTAGARSLRNSLVVTEVALAMLLVIGAGLMLRSLVLLRDVDPGFRADRLVSFRMLLMASGRDFPQILTTRVLSVRQMLDQIRRLPGVQSAASIHMLPLSGNESATWYSRADRPAPPPAQGGGDVSVISDGYFRTMGIPLLAGREFDERDRKGSPPVAVINQTLARTAFPGENPIGKRMRVAWGPDPTPIEIVGVAADVHHNGLETIPDPCLFLPHAQQPSGFLTLVVRTNGDPTLIAAVQEQIHKVNPAQGVAEVRSMESVVAADTAKPALETSVISIFGFLALGLACVGIYAVVSYSVEQRVREMGIRLALGAAPHSILGHVLGEGLVLALIGIGAGLLAALALTRYLATLLYTVRPTDPLVYATVTSILVAAALAGCYFPARRATRVDPALVLREE